LRIPALRGQNVGRECYHQGQSPYFPFPILPSISPVAAPLIYFHILRPAIPHRSGLKHFEPQPLPSAFFLSTPGSNRSSTRAMFKLPVRGAIFVKMLDSTGLHRTVHGTVRTPWAAKRGIFLKPLQSFDNHAIFPIRV
jgi:hypothetical protein